MFNTEYCTATVVLFRTTADGKALSDKLWQDYQTRTADALKRAGGPRLHLAQTTLEAVFVAEDVFTDREPGLQVALSGLVYLYEVRPILYTHAHARYLLPLATQETKPT